MSLPSNLVRDAQYMTVADKTRMYRIVSAAAVARYVLVGSAPGDVSIDLDKVRAEMPAAYAGVMAIYDARMAELSTKAT
jgi:hypothetical protein